MHLSPQVDETGGTTAHFYLTPEPWEQHHILPSIAVAETPQGHEVRPDIHSPPDLTYIDNVLSRAAAQWLGEHTEICTHSLLLNRILERSLRDLGVLRSTIGDRGFFAAGVPWFSTLFECDSLITAYRTT